MKTTILLLAFFVAAFSSCTTAYKTGQTPDDVYFSPASPQDEYVQTESNKRRNYRSDEYYDDRYLRMKVSNRYRWNDFNDWYSYERYGFGYNYLYGSYNNPYNSWNYYYNPYCNGVVVVNPKNNYAYSKPRTFNLGTYNPVATNNSKSSNVFRYTNTSNNNNSYNAPRNSSNRNNSNSGNVLRDIFGSSNNSSKSTNTNSTNNSSNSGGKSSSSSSSGGSAPVRRF